MDNVVYVDARFHKHVNSEVLYEIATAFHFFYADVMRDRHALPEKLKVSMAERTKKKADRMKKTLVEFIDLQCEMYQKMFMEEI